MRPERPQAAAPAETSLKISTLFEGRRQRRPAGRRSYAEDREALRGGCRGGDQHRRGSRQFGAVRTRCSLTARILPLTCCPSRAGVHVRALVVAATAVRKARTAKKPAPRALAESRVEHEVKRCSQ